MVLGVDPQQLWRWKWDIDRSRRVSLTDLLGLSTSAEESPSEPENAVDVEERLVREGELSRLKRELEALPERERDIVRWYDLEGCTLREIGDRIGVSESRVSQLRSRALTRLREQMSDLRGAA